MGVVDRYFDALGERDWEALTRCLDPDVVRVGPYGDTYSPRDAYVEFLAGLMPTLPGYSMALHRVLECGAGTVVAELSETVELKGESVLTPETLVFDIGPDGLIARIAIYIQRAGPA